MYIFVRETKAKEQTSYIMSYIIYCGMYIVSYMYGHSNGNIELVERIYHTRRSIVRKKLFPYAYIEFLVSFTAHTRTPT